jgi:hypothetical protein
MKENEKMKASANVNNQHNGSSRRYPAANGG